MTDENTPKHDETPPPPAEPTGASRAEEAPPSVPPAAETAAEAPPHTTEPTPAAPAAEAHPEPAPKVPAEHAEPAPLVAEVTHAELAPVEPAALAEVAPEAPPAPVAEVPAPAVEAPPAEATPTEASPPEPVAEAPAALAEEPKPKARKPRKPKAAAAEPAAEPEAAAAAPPAAPAPDGKKKWYAVKVQSGREESIKAAIERKVKIENLEQYFGQIVIPVEEVNEKKKVKVKVKDKKTGEVETTTQERNVVKKIKKFPGYIFAEVEFNDEILYVFRETSGVGDFVGIPARRGQGGERLAPAPMTEAEVQSMLTGVPVPGGPSRGKAKTVVKLDYEKGDKVRIKNGAFAGHEAEVKAITEAKDPTDSPKVTVIVTMWGRPVDVDLDYWEVDKA